MNCETCTWAVAELEKQLEELKAKCRPIKVEYAEDGTPQNVPVGVPLLLFSSNKEPVIGTLLQRLLFMDNFGVLMFNVTHFMEIPKL